MTRWLLPILGGLVILLLLVGWVALAPEALGGRATYISTVGSSMEPTISEGALVVLHPADNYQVGDIILYDADSSVVLHRIIAIDGERFIVQGDNNPIPDSVQPTTAEIQGRLWLLLSPPWEWSVDNSVLLTFALISFVIVVLVGYLARERVARMPAFQHLATRADHVRSDEHYMRMLGPTGQVLVVSITVLGMGALLLAAVGFSRPLERQVIDRIPYQHQGTFSYSAPATGTVYEDGIATTGDPLYRDLVDTATVEFRYVLSSELPTSLGGTYHIDLLVGNSDGWNTRLPLVPERQFSGDQFDVPIVLDLIDVESLIAAFEEQAGLSSTTAPLEYLLSVVPTVRVDGGVGGQQVHDTFTPSLEFQVDEQMLSLVVPESDTGAAVDPTQSLVTEYVAEEQSVDNDVAFVIGDLDVATARQLSILGLAMTIVLGTVTLLMIRAAMQAPEPAQIDARYGSHIVGLRAANLKTAGRLVEVAAFEDLVKIAKQRELPILHFQRSGRHHYFVHTVEVTYGYRPASSQQPADPQQALESEEDEVLPNKT